MHLLVTGAAIDNTFHITEQPFIIIHATTRPLEWIIFFSNM